MSKENALLIAAGLFWMSGVACAVLGHGSAALACFVGALLASGHPDA